MNHRFTSIRSSPQAVVSRRIVVEQGYGHGFARYQSTSRQIAGHCTQNTLKSSFSSLLFILPIAISAFIVYSTGSYWNTPPEHPEVITRVTTEKPIVNEIDFEAMATPPGRAGNLTPEQEEKLFELWKLVFQICGVEDDGASETAVHEAAAPLQTRTLTAGSEKPKKERKRLGLFKKKDKKDKENGSEKTPHALDLKSDDPDDKYGHNKVFQETLANRSPESIRASLWGMVKMDHPDQLVLRFLRARKWDVQKALVMLVSTMKWRQDAKVDDDIMVNGEEHMLLQEQQGGTEADKRLAKDFLDQMRMGKSFTHGIDKEGRPMTVVRARLHRAGEQSEESLERYTVFLIETNRHLLSDPIDTGTVIFDMTGFSMANMDYAPVKFMIQCFEANYPESLGVVLVHKAPWIFQGMLLVLTSHPYMSIYTNSSQEFTRSSRDGSTPLLQARSISQTI